MGKNILIPILVIIVTIAIGVFGANFVYGQINSLNQKSADLKQKSEELGVKLATLEKVKDEVTGQANTSRFALPAVNATALALAQVKKIASEEQVTITSVNASGAIVEGKETNEIRLDIKTEGAYEQTKNFYLKMFPLR